MQAEVPFGHFTDALMTRDLNPLEPKNLELKLYAKDVGPVLTLDVSGASGREELLSYAAGRLRLRILLVEDEPKMAALLRRGLEREAMSVDIASRGEDAVWMAGSTEYDAVVLDVMLPGIDGFEVCRRIRSDGVNSPVLMLTARDSVRDRVAGLDGGADDYLTKPFSYAELLARMRALTRRGPIERPVQLEVGDLRLDPVRRRVWRGESEVELSPKEFALLETFMRRPGDILTRFQLLEHAWDYEYENRSNVVDSFIRLLRKKVDEPFGVHSIETVRGAGYRLREDGGTR